MMPDNGGRIPGGNADEYIYSDAEQRIVTDQITEDHQGQDQTNECRDEFNGHPFIPVQHSRGGRAFL